MISITKVFRFEAAHAIQGYSGSCKNIHGHSYELHVAVKAQVNNDDYVNGLGIIFDFKELKTIVQSTIINAWDHKLLLSRSYLNTNEQFSSTEEVVVFDVEPTAENMLIFARDQISKSLPDHIQLYSLKLWETRDSYAEWTR